MSSSEVGVEPDTAPTGVARLRAAWTSGPARLGGALARALADHRAPWIVASELPEAGALANLRIDRARAARRPLDPTDGCRARWLPALAG